MAGDQFTADTYPFRLAKIGADRVFLRASPSVGTARRLWVGMQKAAFAGGSFTGSNTNGQATATTLSASAYTGTWSAGATTSHSGAAGSLGTNGRTGIFGINAGADGSFFAIRSTALLVLVAARGSTAWPGYVEFGKR